MWDVERSCKGRHYFSKNKKDFGDTSIYNMPWQRWTKKWRTSESSSSALLGSSNKEERLSVGTEQEDINRVLKQT